MNNFGGYITPEEAIKLGDKRSLAELTMLSKGKADCIVCGQPAWNFGDTGLCFTCCTGESDASNDYELRKKDEVK